MRTLILSHDRHMVMLDSPKKNNDNNDINHNVASIAHHLLHQGWWNIIYNNMRYSFSRGGHHHEVGFLSWEQFLVVGNKLLRFNWIKPLDTFKDQRLWEEGKSGISCCLSYWRVLVLTVKHVMDIDLPKVTSQMAIVCKLLPQVTVRYTALGQFTR